MATPQDPLLAGTPLVAAELRPPRAELAAGAGMNAWIDAYHAVRDLTRRGIHVFLTDSAVGLREEDNLRHLINNFGDDLALDRVTPFLTAKHGLDYCLGYAERAQQHGFRALVVLGGDRHVGPPRCVEHAWELRERVRQRAGVGLALGGWANPHADPVRQVDFLTDPRFTAEFFLTQVVSHHQLAAVDGLLNELERRRHAPSGIFGVFYYRSANRKTLEMLRSFLPTPVDALTREFEEGASAEDICARTIRALVDRGVRRFYVSNLPTGDPGRVLETILDRAGVAPPAAPDRTPFIAHR